MLVTVGLFEGTRGGKRGKESYRECIISKYNASVYEKLIMTCTKEECFKVGIWGGR
jgi:hypothetical protein